MGTQKRKNELYPGKLERASAGCVGVPRGRAMED